MMATAWTNQWNMRSKRFAVIVAVLVVWIASAVFAMATRDYALVKFLTPYVLGIVAAYCGFETWRPTGLAETAAAVIAESSTASEGR